jgi:hypothetical protein
METRIGTTKVRIVIVTAALTAVLAATGLASAHGSFPSQHYAAASCRETPASGQWAVSSHVMMNRADGYETRGTIGVGGGDVIYGGTYLGPGYSEQWLYYRVVVGTQDRYGNWTWKYGTWMRRTDQLGDHTSGIDTEVETYPGSGAYVRTSYGATGSPEDVSMLTGRIGDGPRLKYIYGQMWWGPIFSNGVQVFVPYTHWEPLGYVTCG